ncbi:uncharacterized protein LAESUDRAFT_744673 [Laetiporus sulphureus 93-53]|uniref:U3 small nucleolar RNA-associated protein 10 n=1 Tax=Laetiporus sulphureus 93-53 TaxID=1314785 RepID=A0A165CRE3_9APHY|nr:uncharacterized protein LAESUDRAFT_744673 [Laetiporus sulphureus 93-53]KZT03292.1 hypothetical protein LAESUDRAFT_744673 [Laetiporus sulphureus 93-53]
MASSLAAQLAQGASLNSSLLVDRTRRKTAESYLFSPKEAQKYDLNTVFSLGSNGFLQLKSIEPSFRQFEQALFSDAAKATDRTLLPVDADAQLNESISSFLPLLGPYLMDAPAGKVIEWLVRRFRINEFNVEDVIRLFLPYHESPHFAKMVTILHIQEQSMFRFLSAYKTTGKALPRSALVTEMLKNSDLSRFISGLLLIALKENGPSVHKALVAFHTGVLLDFVAKSKILDEGTVAFLLTASLEPLQLVLEATTKAKEAIRQESILGILLILAGISQKCHLSPKALNAVLSAVAGCSKDVTAKQLIRTTLCICAPQDVSEKFPRALLRVFTHKADMPAELREALAWVGSEKVLLPLVTGLVSQLSREPAVDLLTSTLALTELPNSISRHAAELLLRDLINAEDPAAPDVLTARSLLSQLKQRHAEVVQQACEEALKQDEGKREVIEQLAISLSMSLPGSSGKNRLDKIVASVSADAYVRAIAVRNLYSTLSDGSTSSEDAAAAKAALRARILDTDASVLEALYAEPTELVPVLLEDAAGYISALSEVLHSATISIPRNATLLHLAFLANHIFTPLNEKDASLADHIVHELFFPYLLFSKAKQKSASLAWDILEAKEKDVHDVTGIGRYELLCGCVDVIRWEQEHRSEGQEDSTELLTRIDLALAVKMAENILASDRYSQQFQLLLAKLRDNNPRSRALGYLVARALLIRLSGEHQLNAALQMLQAMQLKTLEGMSDFMRGVDNLLTFLHDMSLGTAVVLKPNSEHTLQRLQTAILTMLPVTPRPDGIKPDWLAPHDPQSVEAHADTRGIRYVHLMRAVYYLSNSTASLPLLSTNLLRALFMNLADDALVFLAGVWTSPSVKGDNGSMHVRVAALYHAVAFLEAHCATEHYIDFQTILPSILVALQDAELRVREAALECVAILAKLAQAKEVSSIYAYDTIYGQTSHLLQYVDWEDFCKYISALGSFGKHFLHDAGYMRVFHQEYLSSGKNEKKKLKGFKQRIVCYLLSHVNACQLAYIKLHLLQSLETTSSEVKCQILLPSIETAIDNVDSATSIDASSQELIAHLASSFDASGAADLNDASKSTWPTFEKLLRSCFGNTSLSAARRTLAYQLEHGLFTKLSSERKVDLCDILIDISVNDASAMPDCKQLLSSVLTDVAVISSILVLYRPSVEDVPNRASKRARLENGPNESAEGKLFSLTLLMEILGSKPLPGSLDLVACLLETLKRVSHDASSNPADRGYTEQLVMNAVDSALSNIKDTTKLHPGIIRVDILIELIRGANNLQTFHQALLLIAGLARLAPEAVLHNITPVFTLMGTNVFHRDDAYSFRVVQKTIESIVPVMISSLKAAHSDHLDLIIAARDFLRIFTDAQNHIPRHRRTKFFTHLVDVLGPEFMAPVSMLLVDKVCKRVTRQNDEDGRASLALPITVLQHYPTQQRLMVWVPLISVHTPHSYTLQVITEMLHEVKRLLNRRADANASTFLSLPSDDETGTQYPMWRQRSIALLIFCDRAMREIPVISSPKGHQERASSSETLSLLLSIAVLEDPDGRLKGVTSAARDAMVSTLRVVSATEFILGILAMIRSTNIKVQMGALELLAERLPAVADRARQELTPTVTKLVGHIRDILVSKPEDSLNNAALHALRSIGDTLCQGEENSLTAAVPLVLASIANENAAEAALAALLALCSKLGPRMIPHIKPVVQECVIFIRGHNEGTEVAADSVKAAFSVMQILLTTVPTFWGEKELTQVVQLFLELCGSDEKSSMAAPVVRTLAKRIPSKTLLETLCKMWTSLQPSGQTSNMSIYSGYFHVMKRALRTAGRPVVLEHLRPIFSTYQDALELSAKDEKRQIEHELIASFLELVVKLNETAFRPLFRKLSDWAFIHGKDGQSTMRVVTFCHVYDALLDYFKTLMIPYMSFLWQSFLELLNRFITADVNDAIVWSSVLVTLTKTLSYDEGAFWRNDKLQQLVPVVVKQAPVCMRLHASEDKAVLSDCLVATMEAVNDDTLLKSMNLDVLMHSRSENSRLRIYSLECSEALWKAHGGKLLGFVAETTTFIAECAEDENDSVVRAAHKLKDAVESIAGKIDV